MPMDEVNMAKLLPFNSNNNKLYQLVDHTDTKQKVLNIKNLYLSKNEGRLDKVKGLEPEEMCSDNFQDNSINVSTLLELFPKLLRLDDQELPSSAICDTERNKNLPFFKGDIFGSESLKNLILKFPKQVSLVTYFRYSRNMKKCKDPDLN
ncbi:PREDICTED: nuclear RNA export factor 1-like [Chrysochloris asiatica]|uniref:Nuclear RNA export factor 1-like n=1 Tax=Chrysochloris asiatica TaxID=185453 RepID=A0A9B0T7L2_CHRAS|nr:PREDICTED: nuclear RNA export factor 1-like [Chrysochloris asiatica]